MLQWSFDSLPANVGVTPEQPHTRDDVVDVEDYV